MRPTTTSPLLSPIRTRRAAPSRFAGALVEGPQRVADSQRGIDRPQRVLLEGHRRAEERHQSIAQELVDGSFVAVDGLRHQPEGLVHDLVHPFGAELFRQSVGFDHVAEQDGDPFPLAFQGAPGGQDAVGEMLRRVGLGSGAGRRGAQGSAAATAEMVEGLVDEPAADTATRKGFTTCGAEQPPRIIFCAASRADHGDTRTPYRMRKRG